MMRIIAVAQTTFRETIRNKVLLHLFGFALAMMLVGWIVSNWSLGEPEKVVADIGLSVSVLVGCAIALFSGIVLVWGEVEKQTILPIIAKPITRAEFIIGKFFGFASAVSAVYLGMNLILLTLLAIVGTPVTPGLLAAIYLSFWEVLLVVALALVFSSFSAPTMSALFTTMIFIAGRFSGDIALYIESYPLSASRPLLEGIYALIPHLHYFNLRIEAVHNLPIGWADLVWPSLYGALYCTILVWISAIVFKKRDLA